MHQGVYVPYPGMSSLGMDVVEKSEPEPKVGQRRQSKLENPQSAKRVKGGSKSVVTLVEEVKDDMPQLEAPKVSAATSTAVVTPVSAVEAEAPQWKAIVVASGQTMRNIINQAETSLLTRDGLDRYNIFMAQMHNHFDIPGNVATLQPVHAYRLLSEALSWLGAMHMHDLAKNETINRLQQNLDSVLQQASQPRHDERLHEQIRELNRQLAEAHRIEGAARQEVATVQAEIETLRAQGEVVHQAWNALQTEARNQHSMIQRMHGEIARRDDTIERLQQDVSVTKESAQQLTLMKDVNEEDPEELKQLKQQVERLQTAVSAYDVGAAEAADKRAAAMGRTVDALYITLSKALDATGRYRTIAENATTDLANAASLSDYLTHELLDRHLASREKNNQAWINLLRMLGLKPGQYWGNITKLVERKFSSLSPLDKAVKGELIRAVKDGVGKMFQEDLPETAKEVAEHEVVNAVALQTQRLQLEAANTRAKELRDADNQARGIERGFQTLEGVTSEARTPYLPAEAKMRKQITQTHTPLQLPNLSRATATVAKQSQGELQIFQHQQPQVEHQPSRALVPYEQMEQVLEGDEKTAQSRALTSLQERTKPQIVYIDSDDEDEAAGMLEYLRVVPQEVFFTDNTYKWIITEMARRLKLALEKHQLQEHKSGTEAGDLQTRLAKCEDINDNLNKQLSEAEHLKVVAQREVKLKSDELKSYRDGYLNKHKDYVRSEAYMQMIARSLGIITNEIDKDSNADVAPIDPDASVMDAIYGKDTLEPMKGMFTQFEDVKHMREHVHHEMEAAVRSSWLSGTGSAAKATLDRAVELYIKTAERSLVGSGYTAESVSTFITAESGRITTFRKALGEHGGAAHMDWVPLSPPDAPWELLRVAKDVQKQVDTKHGEQPVMEPIPLLTHAIKEVQHNLQSDTQSRALVASTRELVALSAFELVTQSNKVMNQNSAQRAVALHELEIKERRLVETKDESKIRALGLPGTGPDTSALVRTRFQPITNSNFKDMALESMQLVVNEERPDIGDTGLIAREFGPVYKLRGNLKRIKPATILHHIFKLAETLNDCNRRLQSESRHFREALERRIPPVSPVYAVKALGAIVAHHRWEGYNTWVNNTLSDAYLQTVANLSFYGMIPSISQSNEDVHIRKFSAESQGITLGTPTGKQMMDLRFPDAVAGASQGTLVQREQYRVEAIEQRFEGLKNMMIQNANDTQFPPRETYALARVYCNMGSAYVGVLTAPYENVERTRTSSNWKRLIALAAAGAMLTIKQELETKNMKEALKEIDTYAMASRTSQYLYTELKSSGALPGQDPKNILEFEQLSQTQKGQVVERYNTLFQHVKDDFAGPPGGPRVLVPEERRLRAPPPSPPGDPEYRLTRVDTGRGFDLFFATYSFLNKASRDWFNAPHGLSDNLTRLLGQQSYMSYVRLMASMRGVGQFLHSTASIFVLAVDAATARSQLLRGNPSYNADQNAGGDNMSLVFSAVASSDTDHYHSALSTAQTKQHIGIEDLRAFVWTPDGSASFLDNQLLFPQSRVSMVVVCGRTREESQNLMQAFFSSRAFRSEVAYNTNFLIQVAFQDGEKKAGYVSEKAQKYVKQVPKSSTEAAYYNLAQLAEMAYWVRVLAFSPKPDMAMGMTFSDIDGALRKIINDLNGSENYGKRKPGLNYEVDAIELQPNSVVTDPPL